MRMGPPAKIFRRWLKKNQTERARPRRSIVVIVIHELLQAGIVRRRQAARVLGSAGL
jgi:hypothetical protein